MPDSTPNARESTDSGVLGLTAQIVAAHVSNNPVPLTELSGLIENVHRTLAGLGRVQEAPAPTRPEPAVAVKKSVTPEYLVCLEDGKKLKMLKRHLKTAYNMTPDQYRERWNLPPEYPMVAPAYAEHRSSLAKKIGLGTRPRSIRRSRGAKE
ncbi:MucR family transcriptional regulator [Roseomonas sp. KE2513]|uniref:MucR family transcriptional regulator n=1 Tax=Roseomonas sp. KE2513 TaxID=2479202 RepID=UPI0018E028BA|nr:MucR family transcriptional regulator [Roseomonas sp. KE2513]MBI0535877.1 MucR family transcriptional regulator [Roseomonas sp. KE2513]